MAFKALSPEDRKVTGEEAMKTRRMSKLQMARRMNTSRSQLDRLLDPIHRGVTLETLARAAQVLGRHIRVELI